MHKLRQRIARVILMLVVALGLWLVAVRPWESPAERAYRICKDRGMHANEVDWLIASKTGATLTRTAELGLWRQTAEPKASEVCLPCVDAVLDVVFGDWPGVPGRTACG